MAIKDLYKQVESEKKNKVKDDEVYSMAKKDAIAEHKNLVKVLRGGDKKALEAEAVKQEAELEEMMGSDNDDDEEKDEEGDYQD